jgi:hypothetical protein
MIIGDKEETPIIFLHFYEVFDCTKVITEVQFTGWTNTTNDCFHAAKIQKSPETVPGKMNLCKWRIMP